MVVWLRQIKSTLNHDEVADFVAMALSCHARVS